MGQGGLDSRILVCRRHVPISWLNLVVGGMRGSKPNTIKRSQLRSKVLSVRQNRVSSSWPSKTPLWMDRAWSGLRCLEDAGIGEVKSEVGLMKWFLAFASCRWCMEAQCLTSKARVGTSISYLSEATGQHRWCTMIDLVDLHTKCL